MKFSTSVSALAALSASSCAAATTPLDSSSSSSSPPEPNGRHLFTNPDSHAPSSSSSDQETFRIPTSYESAVLGRRILALSPLATLSTVFPTSYTAADEDADGLPRSILLEHRPAGLGGVPIGLMDYISDCGPEEEGNPTVLAIKIATSFKNVEAGSNMSVSVNWVPPFPPEKRIKSSYSPLLSWLGEWWRKGDDGDDDDDDALPRHYDPVPYSAANLPRFSLLGYLEPISAESDAEIQALRSCFLKYHPDAKYWLPGNRIHESEWVRVVVTQVYWIGGFGDRAYIGWIPVEEWKNVTREEWQKVRLPGEKKGWKEWSVDNWTDEFEL